MVNQTPEQMARDQIDAMLVAAGWCVQNHQTPNLSAGPGIALREYPTAEGPVDYLLLVDGKPCGLIEAKRTTMGGSLIEVEEQSERYAKAHLKGYPPKTSIRFVYESTGVLTRFRDRLDPYPRSREVFTFLRPETMRTLLVERETLRKRLMTRLNEMPPRANLRKCQYDAIVGLEVSLHRDRPRSLIQMATGAGKTFTAIASLYRLFKLAQAKRVLMLVDTRQLGVQAFEEFQNFQPVGEQHKFTELYPVQHLTSSHIDPSAKVCISTIQRMYAILKGREIDEDEENNEGATRKGPDGNVVYNAALPPEFFDFLIIDECHRSIYNLWREVLDYFDAFLIGLTATPDQRTYAFFNKNLVSEYTHEQAVLDGVNVGGDVYLIETQITKDGATVSCQQQIRTRDKLTRQEKWETLSDDLAYEGTDLDKSIVNKMQIRTVIQEFKDKLFSELFRGRTGEHVPKTLIFAKDDSHASDIVEIVREVFAQGNEFCKKITYQAKEDPKSLLNQFRNDYYPRIAVTVDMIATGTDVKPLECLLFMRDVHSANYFEQMKGRGTRTINTQDLLKVTPDAKEGKQRYVLVDAIGVTKSMKSFSGSFERTPCVPLKELLQKAALRQLSADEAASLAGRLTRLNAILSEAEQTKVVELSGGVSLTELAHRLYFAGDPDCIQETADALKVADPTLTDEQATEQAKTQLELEACSPFNGTLNDYLANARKIHDQILDETPDRVVHSSWSAKDKETCKAYVANFEDFLRQHAQDLEALQIYFTQPRRRQEVTLQMIKTVLAALQTAQPALDVRRAWEAYRVLGRAPDFSGTREAALLALIRHVAGVDRNIVPFADKVDENYKRWTFDWNNSHPECKIGGETAVFMRQVRDSYKTSFRLDREDFDLSPLVEQGGFFKLQAIFGSRAETVIQDLNAALAA